ncbi:MAG: cyclic pyranopterin monophosphate synthase MoaC [Bordetella sp.]|nr:MAG: cyclic pyranopterin monophosphate synthase MoaC [Bordetella sp.]
MFLPKKFSHLNQDGQVQIVNITSKDATHRIAVAKSRINMSSEAYELLTHPEKNNKGEVLNTARIAAIQAAKRCSDLIPLCHSLPINFIDIKFQLNNEMHSIEVISQCETNYKTGVEMEAMMACSIAALTIYDMCKSEDKAIIIEDIRLIKKIGGKSGNWSCES